MSINENPHEHFGRIGSIPRTQLFSGVTALETMPNLSAHCGGAQLLVKEMTVPGWRSAVTRRASLSFTWVKQEHKMRIRS